MQFFQPEASKRKAALDFFDSDTGDKKRDYRTNWIEYQWHLALRRVSSYFHSVFFAIFTGFFCASHKSERTSCILYFSKTNSYFKNDFTKFQDNSRKKGTFFQIPRFFQNQWQIQLLFQVCANPAKASPPEKSGQLKITFFFISLPKHMLWVLKRTVSCFNWWVRK